MARCWRRRMAALAIASAALAPGVARAWTCTTEPPGVVLPPPRVAAPTDVRPLVRLLTGAPGEPCGEPFCARDVESLQLRVAPGPGRGDVAIPIDVRRAEAGAITTYALRPRAPLAPGVRHEILAILRPGDGRAPGRRRLLGTFRTGTHRDQAPPVWGGFRSVGFEAFHPPPPPGDPRHAKVMRLSFDAQQLRSFAEVWGRPALDEGTPPEALTYAVRVARADGRLDPSSMPLAFFRGEIDLEPGDRHPHRLFWLGQPHQCFAHTFDFARAGKLTIGVSAVDMAGNESAIFPHTFDLDALHREVR